MPQTHGFEKKEKIQIFIEAWLVQNSLSRKIHRKFGRVALSSNRESFEEKDKVEDMCLALM